MSLVKFLSLEISQSAQDLFYSVRKLPSAHEDLAEQESLRAEEIFKGLSCARTNDLERFSEAIRRSAKIVCENNWSFTINKMTLESRSISNTLDISRFLIFLAGWLCVAVNLSPVSTIYSLILIFLVVSASYKFSSYVWSRTSDTKLIVISGVLLFFYMTLEGWLAWIGLSSVYSSTLGVVDGPGVIVFIDFSEVVSALLLAFPVFIIARIVDSYLHDLLGLWVSSRVGGAQKEALQTSRIVCQILEVCSTLDDMCSSDKNYISYLESDVRGRLVSRIERIAGFSGGPWISAMKTGNKTVDSTIVRHGKALNVTALGWRHGVALGGVNLVKVRDQSYRALVSILSGDWDEISRHVDIEEESTLKRYGLEVFKVGVAALAAIAALIINEKLSVIPEEYMNTFTAVAVAIPSIQILALLNPKAVERIQSTKDLVSFVKET